VKREIVINAAALEVRVAMLEDGQLAEFHLERTRQVGLAGNIYKGRVTRVLPGMQAAFVDIGLEKAGFLHVSDFHEGVSSLDSIAEVIGEGDVETDVETEAASEFEAEPEPAAEEGAPPLEGEGRSRRGRGRRGGRAPQRPRSKLPIEEQLHRGQDIIVQIAKEPMGTKGARLTSSISMPGRHLVFTPTSAHVGVSRRIASAEERGRLREIVNEVRPQNGGFIVRTACEGVSRRDIQRDAAFLVKTWSQILKRYESSGGGTMLYTDLDVAMRTVRDLFSSEVEKVWCDEPNTYSRIVQFVQTYTPRLRSRLSLYDGDAPIFDRFEIEPQIERSLERKVWLKSGGYLVFDQAEALTAIDVNTGRFVGKKTQEETILKTNLEAVDEAIRQMRIRNIGGIIILDLIDMSREADKKRVGDAISAALKRDKARTSALKISELGLVQMTRKRTRESMEAMLTETCPRCEGRRVVKSTATMAAEVMRGIHREARRRPNIETLVVKLHPDVARHIYDFGAKDLEALEARIGAKIILRSSDAMAPGAFEVGQAPAAA
jgi:ribonuclease G